MASRKIPPHLARELQRHVGKTSTKQEAPRTSYAGPLAFGCATLTLSAFCFPYFYGKWVGGLVSKEDELTAAQVRRGAFMNSGSRDAGKDPNWDWKNGKYVGAEGYAALFAKDDPDKIEHANEYPKKR